MKKRNNSLVILLTGTINPNTQDILSIKDPEVRKKQYIEAISFYLKETNFNIIFAENSATSLEEYFPENRRIEFLTFSSPLTVPDRGKGWKEFRDFKLYIQEI